jgi:hypothetical protein
VACRRFGEDTRYQFVDSLWNLGEVRPKFERKGRELVDEVLNPLRGQRICTRQLDDSAETQRTDTLFR